MKMLDGKQIILRPLVVTDVTDEYVVWMNDYDIVKYTESRFVTHTKESIGEFIKTANNETTHTFAIRMKDTGKHIGNIKLGGINTHHRYADVGLIIGRKEYHGRGIATECIRLVTEYAFKQLRLHMVLCGIYALNIGSIRAFQKAEWVIYATVPKIRFFEGEYIDSYLLHKINDVE